MVHKTFLDPSPDRILWLSESPSRGSGAWFAFSGHQLGQIPMQICWSVWAKRFHRKWKWRFDRQSQEVHKANGPIESIEDHYRVNYFLPLIYHIISHLNSRFPQEPETIFYGNYLVPALVNNANSEIVNDMKTEYTNDLPYPNDLPHEVDRWVTKWMTCHTQMIFHTRLTDGWQNEVWQHTLQTQFLMLTLTCIQMFLHFMTTSNITSRFLCMWKVFVDSLAPLDMV